MTFKTTKLRDAITFALVSGVTAIAGSGVAYAQDAAPAGSNPTNLDRIEVTGSRIKRVEVETSQPVFSLDRADIQAQGLTSIGDVIQNLAANGSALNSTFNNGGNGENNVSLRNLGSARTLVLVDGRRWVGGTGLGGAVDLNTIPTSMVERIEVLKAGASSIYGSDAIAGVVNVILRKDYQGAEANAYIGNFDKGDGFRESYDFTVGTSDDRFTALFGVGYVNEEPVSAGDREISEFPIVNTGLALASSTTPFGRFGLCRGVINPVTGICSVGETRPNGSAGQFTYDPGQTGANQRNFLVPGDFYNFAPENYLLTPQERISVFGRGSVAITDNVSAFVTGIYNNRKSEQLLASSPAVLGSGPGAGVVGRTISISADSIYNPFGAPVSRIQRRINETGGRSFNQNVDTLGFNGGLEGSFELADRYFTWDAGYTYGRNQQTDTVNGLLNLSAVKSALGPSAIQNGVPVCLTAPGGTVIPGCVPLNLLGAVGSITPEMLAYSSFIQKDSLGYKLEDYYANFGGELFELQGGQLAFAGGIEHRKEEGFDSPDSLVASGNTTGNVRSPTAGSFSVDEAYLELAIPLLKDLPFARQLEFNLSSRYSDYSNFGNTVNSAFGFKWRPIEDLLVRGNYAEGFRAPSIAELFQGQSDSFGQVGDPCSTTFSQQGGYNALTPEQQARCTAGGVPVGGYDQGNPQIRTTVGGNPDLGPETSTTKTLGLVYSPSFIPGFDVSLDWWRIELENTVTTFSGQFVLDQCIREGIQAFCDSYTRTSTGSVDRLLSSGINVGAANLEGYDLTVNYRLPETSFGTFSFTWDTTYTSLFETDNDGNGTIDADDGGSVVGEYFDRDNNWRIRSNLQARWEKGDFGASWFTRYYSRQDESCPFYYNDYGFGELCNDVINGVGPDGTPDVNLDGSQNKIGGTVYNDVSVFYKTPWNAKVTVGVNNVFDKDPPIAYSTFANSFDPQYEVPGKFMYLQYNQKF